MELADPDASAKRARIGELDLSKPGAFAHFSMGKKTYVVPMAMHAESRAKLVAAMRAAGHAGVVVLRAAGRAAATTRPRARLPQSRTSTTCSACASRVVGREEPRDGASTLMPRLPATYATRRGASRRPTRCARATRGGRALRRRARRLPRGAPRDRKPQAAGRAAARSACTYSRPEHRLGRAPQPPAALAAHEAAAAERLAASRATATLTSVDEVATSTARRRAPPTAAAAAARVADARAA